MRLSSSNEAANPSARLYRCALIPSPAVIWWNCSVRYRTPAKIIWMPSNGMFANSRKPKSQSGRADRFQRLHRRRTRPDRAGRPSGIARRRTGCAICGYRVGTALRLASHSNDRATRSAERLRRGDTRAIYGAAVRSHRRAEFIAPFRLHWTAQAVRSAPTI